MLNLLIKDFKLMFGTKKSASKRAIGGLVGLLALVVLVAGETFLFSAILSKIKPYANAPYAFMVLFLVVVSALMAIGGIFQAKRLFFDDRDIQQLAIHPISNGMQVLSKLVFLFLVHYASSFIFVFPLFLAYGTTFGATMFFYYSAVFYPMLSFVFEIGVALIFVYPVWYLLQFLKKHVILEFTISVVILFLLAWIYSVVLEVFVGLVANNELSTLLSADSIGGVITFGKYAVPVNFMVDIFVQSRLNSLFPYLAISGGIFIIGLVITIFTFHKVRNVSIYIKPAKLKSMHKVHSVRYALIKKEFALITRNPDYIYSFSGLLIIQPFLLYLIIVAMNTIFSTGTFLYYTSIFSNFVSIVDVFLVMMFTVIIAAGANQYITMEEKTIKNLKIIPVGYRQQIYVKVLIPMAMSAASLLVSVSVLWISGTFSFTTAAFAFLLSAALLLVFSIVSLSEELKIRHGKPRSTFLSTTYSYLLPFAYVVVSAILSYLGTELWLLFSAGITLFVLLGLPYIIIVNRKMGDWFIDLEAIN